ncbi:MAG: hypothetical protein RMK29_19805 [Myxococcales bacterium]|nr:hypothetical protein [Myxococcota bacterium]MDW8283954.1 hypothetical protein [Myxococcales bacterium]
MRIVTRIAPPRNGGWRGVGTVLALTPAAELTPGEVSQRAQQVAAVATELGVPEPTPSQERDLVLVIDPKARPIADTLRFALEQAPQVVTRSGQTPQILAERNAQVGAMLGLRRLGEQGERAFRLLRGAKVKMELGILERVLEALRAEKERLRGDAAARAKLEGDSAELQELLARREARRRAAAERTRAEKKEAEEKVEAQARETRALRTLLALQCGETVTEAEASEALAYLEQMGGAPP